MSQLTSRGLDNTSSDDFFKFFNFFDFFVDFLDFFCDKVYRYIPIGSRHFVTHFLTLRLTDPKKMGTIWTSRFEDLSLNCGLG